MLTDQAVCCHLIGHTVSFVHSNNLMCVLLYKTLCQGSDSQELFDMIYVNLHIVKKYFRYVTLKEKKWYHVGFVLLSFTEIK